MRELIRDKLEDLIGEVDSSNPAGQDALEGVFSSTADGEWLTIDGVSAPFDVAKFGATAATCDGPAVGGEDTTIDQSDISGAVFVFRRQTAEASGRSCPGPPGTFKSP